jgi:O-antigen/teichoic acid export membrane protein
VTDGVTLSMSGEPTSTAGLFRGLGRGGSLNLLGAVCQQACLLGTTALIARFLGQDQLGRYALSYAVLSLVSLMSLFGFRAALTRFVAVHLSESDPARVRSLIRFTVLVSTGSSLVLGGLLVVFAAPLSHVFHDPGLRTGFVVVGASLPAFTFRDLALAAIQGWRTQRAFALIGWFYEPIARLVLTAGALALGLGLRGAFGALLVGAWTAALAAGVALARRVRPTPRDRAALDLRGVLGFSVVSWGTTLASTGLIWADTLLLGRLADTSAVGVYTVATRLVSLAVFVMAPLNALFAPHFAHFHHQGDVVRLSATYTSATNWILRLSLPAFVVLVVFPSELLGLFGTGFRTGAAVTVLLAVGQLVNAGTGPCGTLLNMSGRVLLNLVNNTGILILNVVLNLLLIPPYGMVGAAVAWSVSLVLVNVIRLLQVRGLMGMTPFNVVTAKSLAAAAVAALVAVVSKVVLPESIGATLAGVTLACLGYVVVTLALRFSADELEAIRGVVPWRSRNASRGST